MSTIYAGNGTIPSGTQPNLARSGIASTTNTTPIQVTTSFAHGYNTGDTIEIEGSDYADGIWQITVNGASTFLLNTSTSPGAAGGPHGYCMDNEVQPAITIPSPGDLAQAGDLALIGEAQANFQPWINRRTGAYRLHHRASSFGFASLGDPWSTTTITSTSASSPTYLTGASPLWTFTPANLNPVYKYGDVLELNMTTTGHIASGTAAIRVFIAFYVTFGTGPTFTTIVESALIMREVDVAIPLSFNATFGIGGLVPGQAGIFNYGLCAWNVTAPTTPSLELWSPWTTEFKQWRPN